MVADGSEEKRVQAPVHRQEDDGGVFKTSVPISAVPDDGEWAISPREKALLPGEPEQEPGVPPASIEAPAAQPMWTSPPVADANSSVRKSQASQEQAEQEDGPEEPVEKRLVVEGFEPKTREYGEMPVRSGEVVFAFETKAQGGWVFGYKYNDKNEVVDEGWLPVETLVDPNSQNDPLDDRERQAATPPPPPLPGDEEDDEQDWKTAGKRPAYRANRAEKMANANAAADLERASREARPARGGGRGTGRGKDGEGRGSGAAIHEKGGKGGSREHNGERPAPVPKGDEAKGKGRDRAKGEGEAKSAARGSGRGGGEKGKGRGRYDHSR